jgi:hypothetical protein
VLVLVPVSLPALPLGLVLGDRLFRHWSETAFRQAPAALISAAGVPCCSDAYPRTARAMTTRAKPPSSRGMVWVRWVRRWRLSTAPMGVTKQ